MLVEDQSGTASLLLAIALYVIVLALVPVFIRMFRDKRTDGHMRLLLNLLDAFLHN